VDEVDDAAEVEVLVCASTPLSNSSTSGNKLAVEIILRASP
jgi:hypothetical protein